MSSTTAMMVTVSASAAGVGAAAVLAWRARRAQAHAHREARALSTRLTDELGAAAGREAALRGIIETTPVAIVLFAESGRIVFTNQAARELFFESAEVQGENFLSMIARAPEPLRRALLSDGDELFTVPSDGASETFHLSKRYFDDGQTLVAVKHVTQEVSRQELATLKKVIRIIGHEINNSLGPISSLVGTARQLLTRPEQTFKLEKILDVVDERSRHLQAFLEGYAKLARIPAPRAIPVPWPPFLDGLRSLWPDLLIVPPSGEQPGFFDAGQIQQVLINLIKNARESGGPSDQVQLAIERPPEGGWRLAVQDRGAGMSDEIMQNALLPFFTTKASGSGLGLALCREIVDLHRGRLRLARREDGGGGMTVSIWLPDGDRISAMSLAASRARLTLTRG